MIRESFQYADGHGFYPFILAIASCIYLVPSTCIADAQRLFSCTMGRRTPFRKLRLFYTKKLRNSRDSAMNILQQMRAELGVSDLRFIS